MAIQHLTLADLTEEQRQEGAKKARERLSALLLNPFITEEQVSMVHAKLTEVDLWEKALL